MRLAEFISANLETILQDWEAFARGLAPGAKMEQLALRDDAEAILRAAVHDMGSAQTPAQQSHKSQGHGGAGGEHSDRLDQASSVHGLDRVGAGFNLVEVVSEYRALRASVMRLWRASNPEPDLHDIDDITRFSESIDQSLTAAVASYTRRVDETRRMFLAILAHDLRNPLNTIYLCAQLASRGASIPPEDKEALAQIGTSVEAINRLIRDLTDFAATGLGMAMPVSPTPMNLRQLVREVVREAQAAHPAHRIVLEDGGDAPVVGDRARLRQVVSNLLGNALQHGSAEEEIALTLRPGEREGSGVVLTVRNGGPPIPAELLPNIFDPLMRGSVPRERRRQGSVGLGLYIVREIVTAHGGSVEVSSSALEGTQFRVRLPQRPPE